MRENDSEVYSVFEQNRGMDDDRDQFSKVGSADTPNQPKPLMEYGKPVFLIKIKFILKISL